jgi:predicted unusual protein kinase regulating ubiquinone biosynthesis (AarF/ABC1/UbiB family)
MIVRLELFEGRLRHKLIMCDAGLVGEMNHTALSNFIELFHAVLRGNGRAAGLQMVQHAPRQECADPEGREMFLFNLRIFPSTFFSH